MNYEIVPKKDTVLVTITDANVTNELDMSQEPPVGCILVQQCKKDVLGKINLEKMLSNLNNCVDLLQITFNAVDSFELQSCVQALSDQFENAMEKSSAAALDFKYSAQDALKGCILAYTFLMAGDVEFALECLTQTKGAAAKMAARSDELVNVYQRLTDYTNSVLMDVIKKRAEDQEKRDETEAMINELEGSVQAMQMLKESLAADAQELDNEYQELREREIREEKRAYGMELASLIIGSVESLVGVTQQKMQSGKSDRDDMEQEVQGGTSTENQAKREYSQNIARQTAIASELEKIDARIKRIDEVLDGELYQGGTNNAKADPTDPDAQKTDEALRQEKQSKVDEKAALNQELNGLKGKESAIQDTLTGLGVAMDDISKKTRDAALDIQKRVDSLAERRGALRKKREELKAMERKNLMELAQNTAKMQNMVISAESLESAIQCLVIAIGCLRKVLVYLHDIKMFWTNVEIFCNNLASNGSLNGLISIKKDHSTEECTVFFTSRFFVSNYLELMAKWQALCVIFDEYHDALGTIQDHMHEAAHQPLSPDRTEQWKRASDMAGALNQKLKQEADSI